MSSKLRVGLLVLVGALVLFTALIVATRSRQPTVSIPASASAAPSASAPRPEPLPARLNFVFDCEAFAPAAAGPCGASPAAETTLLNVVNAYRVSAVGCSAWSADTFEGAEAALSAVDQLDPKALAPLDRAVLQNAALELLSCRSTPADAKKTTPLTATARRLIAKFTLTPEEVATLPHSAEVVAPWLGDGASWKRGTDPRFFHTASDGFARAHRQLQQSEGAMADVVRLVLVNKSVTPFVSDVVQRVVQRRTQPDGIHLCIAELDPASASCGPVALRPLTRERGQRILSGPPPCVGCHSGNLPRAAPYGPDTGFALNDASEARIKTGLKNVLRH